MMLVIGVIIILIVLLWRWDLEVLMNVLKVALRWDLVLRLPSLAQCENMHTQQPQKQPAIYSCEQWLDDNHNMAHPCL